MIVGWDTGTGQPSRNLATHSWVAGRKDPEPEEGESWLGLDWSIREDALDWGYRLAEGAYSYAPRQLEVGDNIADHYAEIREALIYHDQIYLFRKGENGQYEFRVAAEHRDFAVAGWVYPLGYRNARPHEALAGMVPFGQIPRR